MAESPGEQERWTIFVCPECGSWTGEESVYGGQTCQATLLHPKASPFMQRVEVVPRSLLVEAREALESIANHREHCPSPYRTDPGCGNAMESEAKMALARLSSTESDG